MLHKTRTWTRSPKGVPAVKGETQAERAQLIRYFMARDNKVQFAVKFLNVSPSIWSMIENGRRPISKEMAELLMRKVPQITRDYIAAGDCKHVGERFMNLIIEAQAKASGLSQ